jgi:uncharacterized membrane protein YgcG
MCIVLLVTDAKHLNSKWKPVGQQQEDKGILLNVTEN